jgi:hypothetical protein
MKEMEEWCAMEAFKITRATSDTSLGKSINNHLIGMRTLHSQLSVLRAASGTNLTQLESTRMSSPI